MRGNGTAGTTHPDALAETVVSGESEPPHLDAPAELTRGTSLGHFVVLDRLGAGSMGVVVSAYDVDLDRRVAIKLLRPGAYPAAATTEGRGRLLREAQAMARLSHPNVATIHEVGSLEDGVFLVMEHVDGMTLRAWLEDGPRGWREIVEVFTQAGRGLVAAHAAGIVHRDFKPENVIVGDDGRVRVMDFGVASTATQQIEPDELAQISGDIPDNTSMTRTGVIIGTPRYMSPEQHQGRAADHRADEFSFGVALYEALCGELPFTGDGYPDFVANVLAGKLREEPLRDVPSHLRAVVTRALAVEPDARYGSMVDLLDDLSRDPGTARRRWLAVGGVAALVVLAALGFALAAGGDDELCRRDPNAFAGVWDDGVEARVRESFGATGRPYAADTADRVSAILGDYADAIAEMRVDACQATRRSGEQSERMLDLRMLCLDRRVGELAALAEVFAGEPDPAVVDRAVEAARSLEPVAACADREALLAAVPLPSDPGQREQIAAVRADVDRAEAHRRAGQYETGIVLADDIVKRARDVDFAPAIAEALTARARLIEKTRLPKDSEQAWFEVVDASARARDDAASARAWARLVHVVGYQQSRHGEGELLERAAIAALERAGESRELASELNSARAALRYSQARYPEAAELARAALEDRRAVHGDDHPSVASAQHNVAVMLGGQGKFAEAREIHQNNLALREKLLGEEHPDVAHTLHSLAIVYDTLGDHGEAQALLEKALAIRERAFGEDHVLVSASLNSLGVVLQNQERYDDAKRYLKRAVDISRREFGDESAALSNALNNLANVYEDEGDYAGAQALHEQSLAIREKVYGPDHPDTAAALNNLGVVYKKQGRYDDALAVHERALAIRETALGKDHVQVGNDVNNLALLHHEQERLDDARPYYERALAIFEAAYGAEHARSVTTRYFYGTMLVDARDWKAAVEVLERALELQQGDDVNSQLVAATQFALARALWSSRTDRKRARSLAAQARDATDEKTELGAAIREWLAKRR